MCVWQSQAPAGTSKFTGVPGWAALAKLVRMWVMAPAAMAPNNISRRVGIGFSLSLFEGRRPGAGGVQAGWTDALAWAFHVGGHVGLARPEAHLVAPAFGAPEPTFAARSVAARDDGGLGSGAAAKRTGKGGLRFRHRCAQAPGFFGCFGFFGSLRGRSRLPIVVPFVEGPPAYPDSSKFSGWWRFGFRWLECRPRASRERAGTAYRWARFRGRRREPPPCAGASLPAFASWRGLSGVARRRNWVLPWAVVSVRIEPRV